MTDSPLSINPPSSKEIDHIKDIDPQETREWLQALDAVIAMDGRDRARFLMDALLTRMGRSADVLKSINTPYMNTIHKKEEPSYPGSLDIEEKIANLVRWNAMAMVVKANKKSEGIGGHISTFASSATLYEVGYNHFYRGRKGDFSGDQVFFQGHASPGIYARAFIEGKITEEQMENFRRELAGSGGLPSYPHPRTLPSFWQFPTVSMGIGPLAAVYLARFNRYLRDRGIKDTSRSLVWAYLGDGELDEPESLGGLSLAVRENLDNLIFVINCNLQRLDGPVRGNSSIVQEVEGVFQGAGWNVIKVLWGNNWNPIFAKDKNGAFNRLFEKTVDGEFQWISAKSHERRREFFSQNPEIAKIIAEISDEQLAALKRGGHDSSKVYAAYDRAVNMRNGRPTVIIAKTIKGYGMGESGEGRNIAHQQKKMSKTSLQQFARQFSIPISEKKIEDLPFYRPTEDSEEMIYIRKVREKLGSFLPCRAEEAKDLLPSLKDSVFDRSLGGSGKRLISTTKAFVQILSALLREKEFGKRVVPIIPDEARTFGMEGLFRQYGIYSSKGQLYEPVDIDSLMPYREAKDGQILEEGINEAGSLCSFIAAGASYSYQQVEMLPFYAFYSMFGFQRVGDFIWAAADMKCRGFLMGGTAGRTTLNGEGLQHEDGHSLVLASTYPNILCYDPAYEYEMAVIIRSGIDRMYRKHEDVFYYLTMYNEDYVHPPIPKGVEEGILKGIYLYRKSASRSREKIHLISSGVTFKDALLAADILEKKYALSVDVYSAPSFKRLREDTLRVERWNRLHPDKKPKTSYLQDLLKGQKGTFIAFTDYMRMVPDMIRPWIPGEYVVLGTDGFGRSSSREELRRYFEIDKESVVWATLHSLSQRGKIPPKTVQAAMKKYRIHPEKLHGLHEP